MIRTVFGRSKIKKIWFPLINANSMQLTLSTRTLNINVDKGDGSIVNFNPLKLYDFTSNGFNSTAYWNYSTPFTGNFHILIAKVEDVYSISLDLERRSLGASTYNIQDIKEFFSQFTNLYSLFIKDTVFGDPARSCIIKGDLSQFPDSFERLHLQQLDSVDMNINLYLNFSNYNITSRIQSIYSVVGNIKFYGDLSNLPITANRIYILNAYSGSFFTYTKSKIWKSDMQLIYLPLPLTIDENTQLIEDLYNSVLTCSGEKSITLLGFISASSDAHLNYLKSIGLLVYIRRISEPDSVILNLPLVSNLIDLSVTNMSVTATNYTFKDVTDISSVTKTAISSVGTNKMVITIKKIATNTSFTVSFSLCSSKRNNYNQDMLNIPFAWNNFRIHTDVSGALYTGCSEGTRVVTAANTIEVNKWADFKITHSGTALSVYKNGVLIGSRVGAVFKEITDMTLNIDGSLSNFKINNSVI